MMWAALRAIVKSQFIIPPVIKPSDDLIGDLLDEFFQFSVHLEPSSATSLAWPRIVGRLAGAITAQNFAQDSPAAQNQERPSAGEARLLRVPARDSMMDVRAIFHNFTTASYHRADL
jgi:hypothetical protein